MPGTDREGGSVTISFRAPVTFRTFAEEMAQRRGAGDLAKYVRGLILIDARRAGRPIDGQTVPGWATAEVLRTDVDEPQEPVQPPKGSR
jgi:hypothetical protein